MLTLYSVVQPHIGPDGSSDGYYCVWPPATAPPLNVTPHSHPLARHAPSSDRPVVVRDLETHKETSIPHSDLRFCRLGFACTYQALQGRTVRESIRLHCWSHPRFTRKHLYVGLSRAISGDLISIV